MDLDKFLSAFAELPQLRSRIAHVLRSLPPEVLADFENDTSFEIALEHFVPGEGSTTFISLPESSEDVSRCVVLRRKLNRAPKHFALYIIAHEFAHAFLRNGGWGEIHDKEEAADALAASWGYQKPLLRWF